MVNSRITKKSKWATAGIVFGVLFIIGGLSFATKKSENVGGLVFFYWVLGGVLLYLGISTKHRISTFRKYVQFLSADPTNSLDNLAVKSGTSVEKVRKNLEKMIKKNYFDGAWIDNETNSIVLAGSTDQILATKVMQNTQSIPREVTQKREEPSAPVGPVVMVSVKCKGCGAMCTVPEHGSAECEYCGNTVTAE